MNVNTILDWEKNHTDPEVKYYPKIMEFLSYCPIQYAYNFGQKLMLHRTYRGYSHRSLGKVLNIDPATICRWDTTDQMPYKKHRVILEEFFNSDH